MRSLTLAVLLLFPVVNIEAASALQVTFELQPAVTLPGIPVSFHFTFVNSTNSPQPVPKRMLLIVHDHDGNTFAAICCSGVTTMSVQSDWTDDVVSPHQNAVRDIFTGGQMRRPAWFADGRLSQPGTYQLEAWFLTGTLHHGVDSLPELSEIRQQSIISNLAVLTVQEPHGVDAEVWQRMLGFCKGTWSPTCLGPFSGSEPLIQQILSKYPQSTYAGWFATMSSAPAAEERSAILRGWLTQAKPDDYTDWRRLALAEDELAIMHTYGNIKPDASKLHADVARVILGDLARTTKIDAVRVRAEKHLAYLNTAKTED